MDNLPDCESYKLSFGTYKDKTLLAVAKEFPSYLLWIGGRTTKYSVTKQAQEFYAIICKDNPDDVLAVKEFLQDRCRACWDKEVTGKKHVCKATRVRSEGFYHYHPYGKRS